MEKGDPGGSGANNSSDFVSICAGRPKTDAMANVHIGSQALQVGSHVMRDSAAEAEG